MKIACVMVSSVDGKTTQWFNPHLHFWTSKEDQEHFAKLLEQASLIIMGRKTYDVVKSYMKHKKDRLRVILTNEPEKYAQEQIPNQLEFTKDDPKTIIEKLEQREFSEALLVGGGTINTSFFHQKLVNELILTLEPKIFGKGQSIVADEELQIDLELKSVEKLNSKGTLLLTYLVHT
jgi:dihydrofolate reductase